MNLQRKLNTRQMSMIAIGGSIGTGLFLASGASIYTAGPGGAIVAYLIIGAVMYFLMSSLGEMSSYMPASGSFCQYASLYVSPAFGFAMGINYWFNWSITLAAEIAASTVIMQYWFPFISTITVGLVLLSMLLGLGLLSVKWFGESEYWICLVKIIAVIFFVVLGLLIISGHLGGEPVYLKNWRVGDAPFHQGWLAILSVMMIASFSFQGSELIGVSVSESENPRKDIPAAIKLIFWRILLFYVLTILIIGCLIPYTDHRLMSVSVGNIMYSPFTIVMKMAHINGAAWMMNTVVLTAAFSAANSGAYGASRTLYELGKRGELPKILGRVNKRGVPAIALGLTLIIAMLAFLSVYFANGLVYMWLITASSLSGLIAWIGIALSHLRFRKSFLKKGGHLTDLPYQATFHPYSTVFVLVMCLVVLLGQNGGIFVMKSVNWVRFFIAYSGVIIFVLLWGGYKLVHLRRGVM